MKIGIPREIEDCEKRVAATPESIEKMIKLGFSVQIETQSGAGASFNDDAFKNSGAEIISSVELLYGTSDVILKVRAPKPVEIEKMKSGSTLVSFIWPAQNPELLKLLSDKKINTIAMDSVPRISRAQKMDALSSMANIAGYRAVIEAAHHFGRFFTGQITAAGKVQPAKVFVIGAGVAGLSAIGTAASLGAIVKAHDTRPEVADQVKSMGGSFVALNFTQETGSTTTGYAQVMSEEYQKAQRVLFSKQISDADIVITTALIPGRPAPKLITAEMVRAMKPGSVIVDLASEQGGNCELTVPGQVVQNSGVTIIGYTDLPSRLAKQSSQLYGTNLFRLLEELSPEKNGQIVHNMADEVIRGATVTMKGEITWPSPSVAVSAAKAVGKTVAGASALAPIADNNGSRNVAAAKGPVIWISLAAVCLLLLGLYAPEVIVTQMTVFVLACLIGYMVVWNVAASLHTPLMSVTNAISSIVVVGALVQVSSSDIWIRALSMAAVLLTSINLFGGFSVTQRMLNLFKK
jgi:NAD(P) transhydrogenase subunit alpha